jgi:hypothetical protein
MSAERGENARTEIWFRVSNLLTAGLRENRMRARTRRRRGRRRRRRRRKRKRRKDSRERKARRQPHERQNSHLFINSIDLF